MPKEKTEISIFVASPGDVALERARLREIVNDLNIMWSVTSQNVRIELLMWETHTYPTKGTEPQAVINQQIGDDYDIFLGILWHRFGTPTSTSKSGTEEEFKLAKQRNEKFGKPVIMIYFKDELTQPSKIDTEQLSLINNFRISLGPEGVYYWNVSSIDQFEKDVRMHLIMQVTNFLTAPKTAINKTSIEVPMALAPAAMLQEPDDGYLDLLEELHKMPILITAIAEKINAATTSFTNDIGALSAELDVATLNLANVAPPFELKKTIDKAATIMNDYANRLSLQNPELREITQRCNCIILKLLPLLSGMGPNYEEQLQASKVAVFELKNIYISTKTTMRNFQETVSTLPRMTTATNAARKNLTKAISEVVTILSERIATLESITDA